MNPGDCPHGNKSIVCPLCHAGPPPELGTLVSLIAEARTLLLLAAKATRPNTRARRRALERLKIVNDATRAHIATCGGWEAMPYGLQVQIRVCEMGLERLSGRGSSGSIPQA